MYVVEGASPEQLIVVGVDDTWIALEQEPAAGESENVRFILAESKPEILGTPIASVKVLACVVSPRIVSRPKVGNGMTTGATNTLAAPEELPASFVAVATQVR
jgi:hypothetical protein